jgi:hypothetical protein
MYSEKGDGGLDPGGRPCEVNEKVKYTSRKMRS